MTILSEETDQQYSPTFEDDYDGFLDAHHHANHNQRSQL